MFSIRPSAIVRRSLGPRRRRRVRPSHLRVQVEPLDRRLLLSATPAPGVPAQSAGYVVPMLTASVPGAAQIQPDGSGSPQGFTPSQILDSYDFNQLSLNGSGQTIAIVDAYNDPNITGDLHAFDAEFGLPDPPSFRVIGQTGGTPTTATDSGWAVEESLDVEWAHVIAPEANIVLVEANSDNDSDMYAAVAEASSSAVGASVVSMSWGEGEYSTETANDPLFTTKGVTFVAASGDGGSVSYPAASPNVVGVGGTTLTLNSSGGYGSETTWYYSFGYPYIYSSGGGPSTVEAQPTYQQGVVQSSFRTTPDVSYSAGTSGSPTTGYTGNSFAVYDSFGGNASDPWDSVAGTSTAPPSGRA